MILASVFVAITVGILAVGMRLQFRPARPYRSMVGTRSVATTATTAMRAPEDLAAERLRRVALAQVGGRQAQPARAA